MPVSPPPTLSIGLPVFNGELLLSRALDSILAQDFEDFEVIVNDNASEDSTRDIALQYARRDSRIAYHRNDKNIGLARNYNRAFELSTGRYFKWATHDDWFDPTFFRRCISHLEAQPGMVLCCSAVAIHNREGELIGEWHSKVDLAQPSAYERLHRLLWTLAEPHHLYGVFRSDSLRRTHLMQSILGADRVLLAQLALLGRIHVISDPLYHYTEFRPSGRVYSIYNDPRNRGELPLRTWRLMAAHVPLVRSADLSPMCKLRLGLEVALRFGLRDRKLLAAELFRSGRQVFRERIF